MTAITQKSQFGRAAKAPPKAALSTGQMMWRLIAYRPWWSVGFLAIWLVIHIMELTPRIGTKLFFDTLTGDQPFRFGITGIVVYTLITRGFHILTIGTGAIVSAPPEIRCRLPVAPESPRAHPQPARRAGGPGRARRGTQHHTRRRRRGRVHHGLASRPDRVFTYTAVTLGLMISINAKIALLSFSHWSSSS